MTLPNTVKNQEEMLVTIAIIASYVYSKQMSHPFFPFFFGLVLLLFKTISTLCCQSCLCSLWSTLKTKRKNRNFFGNYFMFYHSLFKLKPTYQVKKRKHCFSIFEDKELISMIWITCFCAAIRVKTCFLSQVLLIRITKVIPNLFYCIRTK